MNPAAIRHYIHWLRHRWSPVPTYAIIVVGFGLPMILLFRLVDFRAARTPTVAQEIAGWLMALGCGALIAAAVYVGTRLGTWSLFSRLEASCDGDYRTAWYELMTKYRGLRPDVIDSTRFRRMLLRLCEQIVRHEELTDEQGQWVRELTSLAAESPKSDSRSVIADIASKHGAKMIGIVMAIVVIVNVLRLLMLY